MHLLNHPFGDPCAAIEQLGLAVFNDRTDVGNEAEELNEQLVLMDPDDFEQMSRRAITETARFVVGYVNDCNRRLAAGVQAPGPQLLAADLARLEHFLAQPFQSFLHAAAVLRGAVSPIHPPTGQHGKGSLAPRHEKRPYGGSDRLAVRSARRDRRRLPRRCHRRQRSAGKDRVGVGAARHGVRRSHQGMRSRHDRFARCGPGHHRRVPPQRRKTESVRPAAGHVPRRKEAAMKDKAWGCAGIVFVLFCLVGYLLDWGGHGDDFWGGLPVPPSLELRVSKAVGALIILAPLAVLGLVWLYDLIKLRRLERDNPGLLEYHARRKAEREARK